MHIVSIVRCLAGRHEPNRRKVKWDGVTHVSHCRHCGVPIERHGHKDWRKATETEAAKRLSNKLRGLAAGSERND